MSVAVGEGYRNWRRGRWLTVLTTLVVVAMAAVPTIVDVLGIDRLVDDEQRWEAAGGRMLVLTNEAAGGIDRASCESIGRLDGVLAAASLSRLSHRAGTVNAPQAGLTVVAASEGIGALLGLAPAAGAILPEGIADQLGVAAGDSIHLAASPGPGEAGAAALPAGPLRVRSVNDTSVLGEQYSYGVLLTVPASGQAATCMVKVEAGYLEAARDALPALLGEAGIDAILADRLTTGEYARDFSAEYAERGLKNASLLVGGAVSVLWFLLVWIRRGRDGLYATLAADWPTRATIRLTEGLALIATSVAIAAALVGAAIATSAINPVAVIPDAARHLIVVASVSALGVLLSALIPLRTPLAALKDR